MAVENPQPVPVSSLTPRIFFIVNPAAGATDSSSVQKLIAELLGEQGIAYEIHLTTKEDNLLEILQHAIDCGYTQVAAAGGDGTVSMAAAALIHRNIPLGILPIGSGNLLARALGIPLDLSDALNIFIKRGHIRTIDAMQVDNRYFFLNVSAGFSSLTLGRTHRTDKRRFGMLAYFWRGIEQLRRYRTHIFDVKVDQQEFRARASEVLIANASFMGINPYSEAHREIVPDDGIVDVCTIYSRRISHFLALIVELFTRRTSPFPTLDCWQARESVIIEPHSPLPVQGDGELFGNTPIRVQIVPKALQIIVPAMN